MTKAQALATLGYLIKNRQWELEKLSLRRNRRDPMIGLASSLRKEIEALHFAIAALGGKGA